MVQDSLRGPGWGILAAGAPGWVFERAAAEFSVPPSAGPMQHLIDCLDAGSTPVASIEDARAAFAIALAAYESAKLGTPVRIGR
jgi:predicted dehydrogenase